MCAFILGVGGSLKLILSGFLNFFVDVWLQNRLIQSIFRTFSPFHIQISKCPTHYTSMSRIHPSPFQKYIPEHARKKCKIPFILWSYTLFILKLHRHPHRKNLKLFQKWYPEAIMQNEHLNYFSALKFPKKQAKYKKIPLRHSPFIYSFRYWNEESSVAQRRTIR